MCKRYRKEIVALMAAMGATEALAAGGQSGGTLYFTGAVLANGYSVTAATRVAGATGGLQAHAAASGDSQVVVDFSAPAAYPVPAVVSVAARTEVSSTWQRVEAAGNDTGVRAQYGGFRGNVLTGNHGTLTLSHPRTTPPALAIVTVAYQ